jgi:transcriptional regulator with XRE-family HTH domain
MFYNTSMLTPAMRPTKASTPRELGELLRKEREARGMSQQALANAIGRRRQAIGDIEDGKNVGIMTIFMALAALGKSLEIKSNRLELEDIKSFLSDDGHG